MTTVTIQQNVGGYTGLIDGYVRESRPTTQYTTATSIYADGADSANQPIQGLVSFSNIFGNGPGQIPLGSTITSASLTLTLTDGTSDPVSFYRMASDWTSLSTLTWNSLGNGVQTDGTEALATADVSLSSLSGGVKSIDVMTSLQAWSNGAANYGWMLSSGGSDGFAFNSSETTGSPVLTVTFDPPAVATPGLAVVQSGGTTAVTEGGAGDTLLISLKTAPTSDVTLTIWTAGIDDVTLTPTILTFTAANWQTQQTVTLNAIDDALFEGPESFAGLVSASSSDAAYNGLTYNFTVGVTDNDVAPPPAGLDVTQSGGTTVVTEGGASDTLVIALHSAPTADVTLTIWTAGIDDVTLTP
ncbi:MAG: DNRLRE domain-containing protein, partial [bacterium]